MFKVTLTYLNGDPLLGVLPDTATTPAPTPAPATPATSEPTSSPTPAPATSEPTPAPTPAPHSQPTTSPSLSDPVTAAPSQLTTAPPLFCDSQLEHQDCCTAHDRTGMRLCMWNEGGGVPFCRMQEDRDPDAEFNVGCLPADVDGDEAPDCYDQDEEARCRALGSCLWDLDNEGLGGDDSQRAATSTLFWTISHAFPSAPHHATRAVATRCPCASDADWCSPCMHAWYSPWCPC